MAPPGEIQNQDREKPGVAPLESPDTVIVPIESRVHRDGTEHLRDNVEFLSGIDKISEEEKQKNIAQAAKWQNDGDIDLLRAAGMSLEQVRANPMERHIRLAAMFLERKNEKPGLYFTVNMHGHDEIQWDLDPADIFPSNILTLDLYDDRGKLIYAGAERGEEDGRPGYFDPKTKERIILQHGMGILVKGTQSSMALTDRIYGQQASQHSVREQSYLTQNAQKTVLKEHARSEAAKQGKELKTDKSFFDIFLEDIIKAWNTTKLGDPSKPLQFDFNFKEIEKGINGILAAFGFAIPSTTSQTGSTSGAPSSGHSPSPVGSPSQKPSAYKETKESKNTSTINRQWLMENVGANEREVQKKLVPINFMGTNLRVCKFIAPYLCEAEERAKKIGLNYRADPKQTSCWNWRPIRGKSKTLSMHSWGTAIDINSLDNPWQPGLRNNPNGRSKVKKNIPKELVAIMQDVGFRTLWWDPMHFEMYRNPKLNQGVLHSDEAKALAQKYLN